MKLLQQITLSILALWAAGGCYMESPPAARAHEEVSLSTKLPRRLANLRLVASTPVHIWQDPDYTRMSEFRLQTVELVGVTDKLRDSATGGGAIYPFLVWQTAEGNVLFAPGFNPESVMTAGSFDDQYYEIQTKTKQADDMDRDFRMAEDARPPLHVTGQPFRIDPIPLYAGEPQSGRRRVQVDHSMLVFLLGLDRVWSDLWWRYREKDSKEAVVVVCKTMVAADEAHRQKWPEYKWDTRQQRILDWCKAVVAKN